MSEAAHDLQFDRSGRLRHLITLAGIGRTRIEALLDRAEAMRRDSREGTRPLDLLAGRTVINLFFEPSTRTRTSFDLAAQRLGAQVINFDIARSSTVKGESLLDTIAHARSDALRRIRRAPSGNRHAGVHRARICARAPRCSTRATAITRIRPRGCSTR